MFKKLLILTTFLIVLAGCLNESYIVVTTTTELTTESETITILTTVSWEDVSLSFPEEFIANIDEYCPDSLGFERQFRMGVYRVSDFYLNLASRDDVHHWLLSVVQLTVGAERVEPIVFSLIKEFDIAFEDFERAAKREYLHLQEMSRNTDHEAHEIPNPYLLFTFNLERINDYYSLDPARHTNARLWLEEWLQENEPYASYSAFRAANEG